MYTRYWLTNKINFYFNKNKNLFYCQSISGITYLYLPFYYFYTNYSESKSFKFVNYYSFKSYLSFLNRLYSFSFKLFFFKLKLKGLGYRIKRITKYLFRLFFTLPNYIYLHIPFNVIVKHRRKRLIFISNNLIRLRIIIFRLLLLKQFLPYDTMALNHKGRIFLLKPGKKPF